MTVAIVGDEYPAVFEGPLASAGTGLARWCARLGPAGRSVVSWGSYSAGFGRDLCEAGSGVVGDADASAETSGAMSTDSASESSWGAGNSVVRVDQAKPSHLRGTDWGWQLLVVVGAGRLVWVPIIRSWALTRGFALHPATRNRYEIRYTRTQHRHPTRQANDHGRVSGTHRVIEALLA